MLFFFDGSLFKIFGMNSFAFMFNFNFELLSSDDVDELLSFESD